MELSCSCGYENKRNIKVLRDFFHVHKFFRYISQSFSSVSFFIILYAMQIIFTALFVSLKGKGYFLNGVTVTHTIFNFTSDYW